MATDLLYAELVAEVHRVAAGEEPLARLEAAVVVGAVVSGHADRLLDEFVGEARRAGHSWTEIGERLGVSKQAARQRFADRTSELTMQPALRPRLRTCLAAAERGAQADGSAEVGTHHLFAGLLEEGVAAAILERHGVTANAVQASSHRLFGEPGEPSDSPPPMGEEAARVLDTANQQALASGCTETGTEHVLCVLVLDPGSRARRVLGDLGTDIAAIKRELGKPPRRRWWQHRPEAAVCSFCRRPAAAAGQLVAGPGTRLHICASCTRFAADMFAEATN